MLSSRAVNASITLFLLHIDQIPRWGDDHGLIWALVNCQLEKINIASICMFPWRSTIDAVEVKRADTCQTVTFNTHGKHTYRASYPCTVDLSFGVSAVTFLTSMHGVRVE
jgi:hypothetical protein